MARHAGPPPVQPQATVSDAAPAPEPKPIPPPLNIEAREARAKALRPNNERVLLRKRLQAGELAPGQALALDDEAARGMRISAIVRALPAVGVATSRRLLAAAGISGTRRNAGRARRGSGRGCSPRWPLLVLLGLHVPAADDRDDRRGRLASLLPGHEHALRGTSV